ncbi:hypothetical protein ODJ79_18110 [Actinoplanes sp. KI2]|uniref:hypothetical protein n=1 Tax=Actinoplanes sp. KI2 TaxID=2983315 RepID=UPI0021D603F7|nr:hypothetical protein [Actinoplanes sp. KI2]MCU7725647.1 hypothetical protein [Actinoplanes sp. KI2]
MVQVGVALRAAAAAVGVAPVVAAAAAVAGLVAAAGAAEPAGIGVVAGIGPLRLAGLFGLAGPRPIPEFGASAAPARAGTVPASASGPFSNEPRPFTTPRYAPAAPTTVSAPSAVTSAARRDLRTFGPRAEGLRAGSPADSSPPKVFIPVEVTSGPRSGGSAGRPLTS